MLTFRGTGWYRRLSAEAMQQVTERSVAWFNRLKDAVKVITGKPLERNGKTVSRRNELMVSDGPFGESREAIEGYVLLEWPANPAALRAKSRITLAASPARCSTVLLSIRLIPI